MKPIAFDESDISLFRLVKDDLVYSEIGLEKESLRVNDSKIANSKHPRELGASLTNRYITTDFSESQIELITPPENKNKQALKTLDEIHHFVSSKIGDEFLWPFSIPVKISHEHEIPIAKYGSSNIGRFKEIYRSGLSHRYGRMMQAISGVHYNFSLPKSIWKNPLFINKAIESKCVRSDAYFNMLRNIHRVNWLILFLFGASPILTKNFISKDSHLFKKLDNDTYYMPFATSLRMSQYGYQNAKRRNIKVSYNSLNEYILDIREATNTLHPDFKGEYKSISPLEPQINRNVLQIDDEYYAIARPKSSTLDGRRTTSKLQQNGVDFIELRSLDIDPFSRIGINYQSSLCINLILYYCFIKQDHYFTNQEIKPINQNDSLVAAQGRKADLFLNMNNEKILLKDWGNRIIDQLQFIASEIDDASNLYSEAAESMREKLNNPNETISAKFLEKVTSGNESFFQLGRSIGQANKEYYSRLQERQNSIWKILDKEVDISISKKKALENTNSEAFDLYIEKYFNA